MAGIEKMDEITGENCGWKMYGWKHNHIQVKPENRKSFKGKKAILFIFRPDEYSLRHICRLGGSSSISYNKEFYEKIDGKWYEWRRDYKHSGQEIAKPIRVVQEYSYCLYVPDIQGEVNGCFYNYSFKISAVKRRMKRMLGYDVPVVKLDKTQREFCNYSNSIENRISFFNNILNEVYK